MIFYFLEPAGSRGIRVRLEERGALQKRILYLSTLKAIARPEDQAALSLLVKAKLRASSGQAADTLPFQQIELDPKQASEALRPLAETKRLHWQKTRIQAVLPGEIAWEGEALGDGLFSLAPFLRTEGAVPLSEPLFSVEGHTCFLLGENLVAASGKPGKKGVLNEAQLKRLLEDGVKVSWQKKQEAPLQVFPCLELHDPMGCFAALRMDYPGVGEVPFHDPSPLVGGRKRLRQDEQSWESDLREAGYVSRQSGRSFYHCPGDKIADALSLLLGVGWRIETHDRKRAVLARPLAADLREEGKFIAASMPPEGKKLLAALREGRSWIEQGIEQGESEMAWIDRRALLPRLAPLLDGEWRGEELYLPKERLVSASLLQEPAISWKEGLKERLPQAVPSRAEPGTAFRGTLLPYQQEGVDWMAHLHRLGFGGLLADEMGLGKTVQVLAFISRLTTPLPVLVVAPSSLLYQWRSECGRFLPGKKVMQHAGTPRASAPEDLQGVDILLTSYAILRQDEELLSLLSFEAVFFDESNAFKNSGTRTFEAAKKLSANSRFCLSGTPVENRLAEMVAQFDVILPKLLVKSDLPNIVRGKTAPFLKRRKKSDVALELPERIEQTVWIEATGEQKQVYDEMHASLVKRLKPLIAQDGAAAHRMEILEAILRLRQICCDPRLTGSPVSGAKLERLESDLEELAAEGKKVLVYSQFTSFLDLAEELIERRGWKQVRLDGSTAAEARRSAVEQFQQTSEPMIFLVSLKAGGVGLNLTAADAVLLLDPWWNEAAEEQAISRAHRMGRKHSVLVKRYLTPGSIEERILSLKRAKQEEAVRILDADPSTSPFDAEEWLSLLD